MTQITPTTKARIYNFAGEKVEIPLITLVVWAAGLDALVRHGIDIKNIEGVVREYMKTPDNYPLADLYDHIQTCAIQTKNTLGVAQDQCRCKCRPVELCFQGENLCSWCVPLEHLEPIELKRCDPTRITCDGFGEITEVAMELGWVDTFGSAEQGNWTPQEAEACEESALDYLREHGVVVVEPGDDDVEES